MAIRITCPGCDASYAVNDDLRGKKTRCRECDGVIAVPAGRKGDDGVFDAKGKSAPVPASKRRDDDDDDRPASRPARAAKKGGGMLAVLLIGAGSLAVVGFLVIVLGVVLFFVWHSSAPEPVAQVEPGPGMGMPPGPPPPMPMPLPPGENPVPIINPGPDVNPPPVVGPGPNNPPPAGDPQVQIDPETLKQVKQSTVYLRVTMPGGMQAEGSGFFAVEPGIVITNAHVLGMLRAESPPPANVDVVVHSGEPGQLLLRGQVLGVDRATDLAVIRVAGANLPPPLPVDSAAALVELQKVYIFGYPFGKNLGANITITAGDVSSIRKDATGAIERVQLNGDMQPGNSGGPVVDGKGRVVGVAVAIIKGTRINFAVPAESVKAVFEGRLAEASFGEAYLDGKTHLPVKYQLLDPLGRVQSVRVEVWAGNPGADRLPTLEPPVPVPGDERIEGASFGCANGVASGTVTLPALKPGQVCWVRPVLVGAPKERFLTATVLPTSPYGPLQLNSANLTMQLSQPGERTVKMKDLLRMTVYKGNQKFTDGLRFEADLLETLTPSAKGTAIRVTVGNNRFDDETDGNFKQLDPSCSQRLRDLSPNFLVDATGKLRTRGPLNINPALPPKTKETLEMMLARVYNAIEETSLYLPNRTVQPKESWPALVPTIVGKGLKKKVLDMHLVCTYQGFRTQDNRPTAVIGLAGVIKSRGKLARSAMGKVTGRAVFDVGAGYLYQVDMKITNEVDFGDGMQIVLTDEVSVSRSAGNPLGIVVVAKKDPPVGNPPQPNPPVPNPPVPNPPIGNPPVVKPPMPEPPVVKPPLPEPPVIGKEMHRVTRHLTAKSQMDLMGKAGCRAFTVPHIFQVGKTYVIEMRPKAGSTINPFLRLLDPTGRQIANDDDSGGGVNARITFKATHTGVYRIVCTTSVPNQFGAYTLIISNKD